MLTKSRLTAWRQCPKRLWLETNGGAGRQKVARFSSGQSVGGLAQQLLGNPQAEVIDRSRMSAEEARKRTAALLNERRTVFEAAFGDERLLVYADIVRPSGEGSDLIEVKDSGSAKPHHVEDAAIQLAAAARSDVPIDRVIVAHVDTGWVYPGGGDYRGFIVETDVSEAARELAAEVPDWMRGAHETLALKTAPERLTGRHCAEPHECRFLERCRATEPVIERPLSWLPGQLRRDAKALRDAGATTMDEIPDEALNPLQLRVKTQTRLGVEHFDRASTAAALEGCEQPLHFLDFETINPTIPIWAGTRPYAQIPFQFSLHLLTLNGQLEHTEFLIATGEDPSRPFAEALLAAVRPRGAVVVYNAAFERTRIRELANRFNDLGAALDALAERLFDLEPVAKAHYYHPDQRGSWSIKKLLPCLVPQLRHDALVGVSDGTMAIEACLEMMHPDCPPDRRVELDGQLRRYCRLDTLAMVGVWARFSGSDALLEHVLAEAAA